jgi:hypothetical protein
MLFVALCIAGVSAIVSQTVAPAIVQKLFIASVSNLDEQLRTSISSINTEVIARAATRRMFHVSIHCHINW